MNQAFYLLGLTIDKNVFPAAQFTDIGSMVNILAPLFTLIAAILFGVMMVRVGLLILTAGSDKEKVTKAGQTATWAIIGLVVVISAYLIIKLLEFILKVDFPI
jgi:cytochrome bd-type quinol oxidase subunit 2